MVQFALDNYGQLDVLLNNAGIELYRPLVETEEEDWDQILAVNVKGIYLCSKHAIPRMAETGGGSIINIASVAGLVGFPGLSAYNASKGAVVVLTKNMALESAPQRIRVNCICPGVIQTPMIDRLCEAMGDYETQQQGFLRMHPLGRLGTPQDIANATLYLASEESSFVTGTALVVDGGFTAQ
jgi:dihydroanticapsin dehydrogenase